MITYKQTILPGVIELVPEVINDSRGSFTEVLHFDEFFAQTNCQPFVQENESTSVGGVLRGLHLQKDIASQAKLVRCTQGKVIDVAVDLREESDSFGKWVAVLLDSELKNQLYIPHQFAHGFLVISPFASFTYKVDNPYNPDEEFCITPFDAQISIPWQQLVEQYTGKPIETLFPNGFILSEKDLNGHTLNDYVTII